jgi:hypothetical protein
MVLEKLTHTLMRTAIEQAGAERGLLIVEQQIAAEAVTSGDSVLVQLCDEPVTAVALAESVLHYVVHTPFVRPIRRGTGPFLKGWRRCDAPSDAWRRS